MDRESIWFCFVLKAWNRLLSLLNGGMEWLRSNKNWRGRLWDYPEMKLKYIRFPLKPYTIGRYGKGFSIKPLQCLSWWKIDSIYSGCFLRSVSSKYRGPIFIPTKLVRENYDYEGRSYLLQYIHASSRPVQSPTLWVDLSRLLWYDFDPYYSV